LPAELDLAVIVPPKLHRYLDAARWFVHLVTTGSRADTKKRSKHRRGVPIRHVDMARFFRKEGDWTAVRRAIIGDGVVECNERYRAGCNTKQYWLSPTWEGRDVVKVAVTDHRFLDKLFLAREAERESDDWQPVHHHLRGHMDRITLDVAGCRRRLCQQNPCHRRRRIFVGRLESGDYRMEVKRSTGRVYSLFAHMPKVIRSPLRCDDEPMVEIDVSGSQPLCIAILASLCWNRAAHVDEIIAAGAEGEPPTDRGLRMVPGDSSGEGGNRLRWSSLSLCQGKRTLRNRFRGKLHFKHPGSIHAIPARLAASQGPPG
jgi:hypothetical protein